MSVAHFAKLPVSIIDDSTLSSDAKIIFAKLLSFCGDHKREVFGYTKKIASILNCSVRKVQRIYHELIDAKLIIKTNKKHLGIWTIFEVVDMFNKNVPCDTHDLPTDTKLPT